MHGGEDRNRRHPRHMWPVPLATPVALSDPNCLLKGGRKIRVGDCALFQAGSSPPFIGIIRWFVTSKEDCLKLCVSWLYRPADVKLAKGIILESAPNEVFYSFHKDVITAASLLHPCKVAFLRKGVDLPSGVSSFVCRRVYDIENKCLWWLTDQDYINERQEEVDQLLDKTRLEMHAAVQSGGRSPKSLNGPAPTQQLKLGSDVQNSGTSFPSQVKGKKRDRGDQVNESIKRERFAKTEDVDSLDLRLDGMIKAEIAKITDKGGLTNTEGVDKLVHLMQLDRAERKIDLAGRVLVADVIAATDRNDCLSRFVQLRGVPVLDDWIQEAHKGKSGDGSSPKESDKAVEELLLALLRALDKLPVSLNALQTCNIGKSVNHLRSHKNLEIHKKARSLVDTWKKRVDAEIKNNDAKSFGSSQSVQWPGKPGFSEVSHVINRRAGSVDVALKSPIAQPSTCRGLPSKLGHTDAIVKSAPVTAGSLKLPSSLAASVAISPKDTLLKAATSSGNLELPQTTAKEEKSSSSSHSQNNSQSCSSDHARTMSSSWKEDARSSSSGSMNASKTSGGSSRHRKSSNGFPGTSISGVLKETNLGKSGSPIRSTMLDKVSPSTLTCDVPVSDQGNSHRLIVRLPNPGRTPVQSSGGVSFEDPSVIGSRGSSPSALDKHESSDCKAKVRGDLSHTATDVNTESWQSNKVKITGSDEFSPSPAATLDEEHRSFVEKDKAADVSRATCSSSGNEKGGFLTDHESRNFSSSMNALIESCVKHSEASAPLSVGDDIGMNLLASVATGEISKSDIHSPKVSAGSSPLIEEPCAGNSEAKSRLSCDDGIAQSQGQSDGNADVESEKHGKCAGHVSSRDESEGMGTDFSGDKKIITPLPENNLIGEHTGQHPVSSTNLHKAAASCIKLEGELEKRDDKNFSLCNPAAEKDEIEYRGDFPHQDNGKNGGQVTDSPPDCKLEVTSSTMDENKSGCEKIEVCEKIAESDFLPFNNEVPSGATSTEQKLPPVEEKHAENIDRAGTSYGVDELLHSDSKTSNTCSLRANDLEQIDSERKEPSNCAPSSTVEQAESAVTPLATTNGVEEVEERKEVPENHPPGSTNCEPTPTFQSQEVERCTQSTGSKLSGTDAEGRDEFASSAEASSLVVAAHSDTATKLDFDLNEGIAGDDGNQSEPLTSAVLVCSSAIHVPSSFSSSPMSNGSPAPITAAPAKGPFVPPENLLKKAEPGWKGSAATSAFRPAEPRKVLEMPLVTSEVPSSAAAGNHSRPPLDIDLNVPDESLLEEMASQGSAQTTGSESGVVSNRDVPIRSSGGLGLDLNIVDQVAENGQFLASTSRRPDPLLFPVRLAPRGMISGDANMLRDFDLNNGPGLDEVGAESLPRSQHIKSNTNIPFLSPVAGLRDFGSVSSWFPPGNSYPAVAIPPFLPDRGEQPYPIVATAGPQRILGSVNGGGTFGGDIYRGPVLSSSPAMAFSPATAFPYAGFPFGSSFPVPSTSFSGVSTTYADSSSGGISCFPAIPSQLVGPGGAISSHYPRPYVFSLPEGSTSGGTDSSRKWARQGLDLNAGPGSSADAEVKDDRFSSAPRQLSLAGSQAFVEDQARLYQVKRKEPDGGWDADRFSGYKQHSWQ